jgi:CTP:molybdopterin cytidylyltransferase MocA
MEMSDFRKFPLILLVGGQSVRMGCPKGLLRWNQHSWLEEQLDRFEGVGGHSIVVVLGFHNELYQINLPWIKNHIGNWKRRKKLWIQVAINSEPSRGQFSSIQTGIGSLFVHSNYNFKGAFILPIDVPCPSIDVWKKLVFAFETNKGYYQAYLPQFEEHPNRWGEQDCVSKPVQNKGGHPPLLSRDYLGQLIAARSEERLDVQLRQLSENQILIVEVNSGRRDTIKWNLNTPQEWQNFSEQQARSIRQQAVEE